MLNVEENKHYRFLRNQDPISEKIEAYHSDEMRKLWLSGSRDWTIYSKKIMEAGY